MDRAGRHGVLGASYLSPVPSFPFDARLGVEEQLSDRFPPTLHQRGHQEFNIRAHGDYDGILREGIHRLLMEEARGPLFEYRNNRSFAGKEASVRPLDVSGSRYSNFPALPVLSPLQAFQKPAVVLMRVKPVSWRRVTSVLKQ